MKSGIKCCFTVTNTAVLCCVPSLILSLHHGAVNNLPDDDAARAAREVVNVTRSCAAGDLLLVLISGGGSALLPMPIEGQAKLHVPLSVSNFILFDQIRMCVCPVLHCLARNYVRRKATDNTAAG